MAFLLGWLIERLWGLSDSLGRIRKFKIALAHSSFFLIFMSRSKVNTNSFRSGIWNLEINRRLIKSMGWQCISLRHTYFFRTVSFLLYSSESSVNVKPLNLLIFDSSKLTFPIRPNMRRCKALIVVILKR